MKRLASVFLAAFLVAGSLWAPLANASHAGSHRDLTSLVNATMSSFVKALNKRSMEHFAPSFISFDNKSQELEKAYSGLYQHAEMFAQMGAYAPVITELASSNEENGLVVRGYYPGKFKIGYEMLFVLENNELKLSAFTVNVTPTASLDA